MNDEPLSHDGLVLAVYVDLGVRTEFTPRSKALRFMREAIGLYNDIPPSVRDAMGTIVSMAPIPVHV